MDTGAVGKAHNVVDCGGALGAPVAVVDSPYVLDLYGSEVADRWLIDWGDSPNLQEVSPTHPQVTHVYENEFEEVTIRAYLLGGDEEPLDVTPAAVRLAVVTPDFLIYSDDTTFPQIEGQPVGLFLTDRDALLEFQVEQAQPGDTYRIIWGDGTESDDYVLVDADNNNEVDPVQWLAGDLLELHEYYTLEKVTAIPRLQTQSNTYYSNAVMFEMQSPVEIEISHLQGGSTEDLAITVRRTSVVPEGDLVVYLGFDVLPGVDFTVSGEAYLGNGQVAIADEQPEAVIQIVGLPAESGGLIVQYAGYSSELLGVGTPWSTTASSRIWAMRRSGQVTEIANPAPGDLVSILGAAIMANDPIINLSLTGHGESAYMDLGDGHYIQESNGQIIVRKKDDGDYRLDVTNLMQEALASDAQVNLQGCYTAAGFSSIARRLSQALPGRAVWGTTTWFFIFAGPTR